ncbi:MAG: hypothetical protein JWO88_3600 [Frankiales bacterium]|nr:hypothetical protein [Frankiales bacterium]
MSQRCTGLQSGNVVVSLLLVIVMVLIIGPLAAVVILGIFGVIIGSLWTIALIVSVFIGIISIGFAIRARRDRRREAKRGWMSESTDRYDPLPARYSDENWLREQKAKRMAAKE